MEIRLKNFILYVDRDKAQMLPYALFYRKDQLDVVASEKDRLLADKEEEIAAKQGELEEKKLSSKNYRRRLVRAKSTLRRSRVLLTRLLNFAYFSI